MITEELAYGCTRHPDEHDGQHARPHAHQARRQRGAEEEVLRHGSRASRHGELRDHRARRRQRRRRAADARCRSSPTASYVLNGHEGVDHQREPRELLRHLRDREPRAPAQGHRRVHRASRRARGSGSASTRTSSASAPATPRRSCSTASTFPPRRCSRRRATASSSRWRPSTRRAPTSARRASALMRRCARRVASPTPRSARRSASPIGQPPARAGDDRRDGDPRCRRRACSSTRRPGTSTRASAIRIDLEPAPRRSAPTRPCSRRSTPCRSSAATGTSRSTRSRS